jgi:hypothetical protein
MKTPLLAALLATASLMPKEAEAQNTRAPGLYTQEYMQSAFKEISCGFSYTLPYHVAQQSDTATSMPGLLEFGVLQPVAGGPPLLVNYPLVKDEKGVRLGLCAGVELVKQRGGISRETVTLMPGGWNTFEEEFEDTDQNNLLLRLSARAPQLLRLDLTGNQEGLSEEYNPDQALITLGLDAEVGLYHFVEQPLPERDVNSQMTAEGFSENRKAYGPDVEKTGAFLKVEPHLDFSLPDRADPTWLEGACLGYSFMLVENGGDISFKQALRLTFYLQPGAWLRKWKADRNTPEQF